MSILNFFKNKIATFLVVIATFILSGVAIFTAVKLYQTRQKPVAPTAPESEPQAQIITPSIIETPTPTVSYPEEEDKRYLAFTINESLAATPTPTVELVAQVTPAATATLTPTPTAIVTATPTATLTPTATTTPTQLLDAGTSLPTIIAIGFSFLLIMGALLLAI